MHLQHLVGAGLQMTLILIHVPDTSPEKEATVNRRKRAPGKLRLEKNRSVQITALRPS